MTDVDINSLSPQELQGIKLRLDDEVERLTSSFAQLRSAGTKYRASHSALDSLAPRELLVPLTGSLYVPGRLIEADKVLVELGTGYYCERSPQQAKEICERKMKLLKENMDKIAELINARKRYLDMVLQVMQKKAQSTS
jgi:prefoldin alpha subunit